LYTLNYVGTATSTTLEFAGADSFATVVLLDSITVTDDGAVPEPATLALTGAGLVVAGLFRKWKK
jgi:hypothetical protein